MVLFDAIREAMGAVRARTLAEGGAPTTLEAESIVREAHMRRCIRAALKEGHTNIAVICGAWHAPVLTAQSLKEHPAREDDALLKPLEKRKTAATWIPWTFERLAADSGYGAGITSPGWYEHLWLHQNKLAEHWLARVARLMRDEDLEASPASIVEAVRLAQALASLRGITTPGLEELTQATLAIFCHGNPLPLRVIERKLIVGDRLGEVPEACPSVPLQQDLAAQVIAALGIHHLELLLVQHQLLDIRQRDVGAGLGVVQAAVRVLLDEAGAGHGSPRDRAARTVQPQAEKSLYRPPRRVGLDGTPWLSDGAGSPQLPFSRRRRNSTATAAAKNTWFQGTRPSKSRTPQTKPNIHTASASQPSQVMGRHDHHGPSNHGRAGRSATGTPIPRQATGCGHSLNPCAGHRCRRSPRRS
jgi:hypothetical protein